VATRATARSTLANATTPARATSATTPVPTPSASTALLDQQQPVVNGGLNVRYGATQTIAVGQAGSVVRVDLALCSPTKNSDIELTVSSTGATVQSATASITFKHSYSDCAWYTFTLSQPLSAPAGEVLTLTVATKNHKAALWGKDGRGDDPYPPGTGTWRGLTINDFAFRTYVQ
jgi:hypothetical protein